MSALAEPRAYTGADGHGAAGHDSRLVRAGPVARPVACDEGAQVVGAVQVGGGRVGQA
jgi:hypothetical protein